MIYNVYKLFCWEICFWEQLCYRVGSKTVRNFFKIKCCLWTKLIIYHNTDVSVANNLHEIGKKIQELFCQYSNIHSFIIITCMILSKLSRNGYLQSIKAASLNNHVKIKHSEFEQRNADFFKNKHLINQSQVFR